MAEKFQPLSVCKLDDSYDDVIIGSGGTGLAASIQAHELGMKVASLVPPEPMMTAS